VNAKDVEMATITVTFAKLVACSDGRNPLSPASWPEGIETGRKKRTRHDLADEARNWRRPPAAVIRTNAKREDVLPRSFVSVNWTKH
jgi:hypothetical protein